MEQAREKGLCTSINKIDWQVIGSNLGHHSELKDKSAHPVTKRLQVAAHVKPMAVPQWKVILRIKNMSHNISQLFKHIQTARLTNMFTYLNKARWSTSMVDYGRYINLLRVRHSYLNRSLIHKMKWYEHRRSATPQNRISQELDQTIANLIRTW